METSHRLEESIAKYSSDKWLVSKNTKNLIIRKIQLRNELKILTDKSPKKIAKSICRDVPFICHQGNVTQNNTVTPLHTYSLCLVTHLCPTLCSLMDCNPPGSSSMEFYRQEYRSELPFPRGSSQPGIKPVSLVCHALAGGFFTTRPWKPCCCC